MSKAKPSTNKKLDGSLISVAIVQARFNESITNELVMTCKQELFALGVDVDSIVHVTVPGALEIPFALQALAECDEYDALIAIGCVIRGETFHFELVARESAAGVSRLSLDYEVPIINAILTTENVEQAQARAHDNGRAAARAAVEMANFVHEAI